jgi:CubicO group peptidase (beta-lactamase class C family)
MRTSTLSVLVVLLLGTAPALTAQCEACVFPGEEWAYVPRAELQELGWNAAALQAVTDHLVEDSNSTGVVVVDRGQVVYTFGDVEELSYLASVRKSILAMLYGYWVENGTIDLNATMEDLGVDDIGGLLPIEKQARSRRRSIISSRPVRVCTTLQATAGTTWPTRRSGVRRSPASTCSTATGTSTPRVRSSSS